MLRCHSCLRMPAAVVAPTAAAAAACSSGAASLTEAVDSVPPMPVYLKPSSSPRRHASFYFPRMREECRPAYAFQPGHLRSAAPLFSITASSCEYYALRLPLLKAGFRRIPAETRGVVPNLLWGRSMPFREMLREGHQAPLLDFPAVASPDQAAYVDKLRMVDAHQRFNHFPLSHANLGCKRGMAANVRRALDEAVRHATTPGERAAAQARYSFVPRTWFYPQERESLVAAMAAAPSSQRFIWKPARGSCGRGILISKGGAANSASWSRVMASIEAKAAVKETRRLYSSYVVQEYIEDPFLVEGRKMDLRLYVAVTSFNPLCVYLHEEGLVRFAAEPYTDAAAAAASVRVDAGDVEVGGVDDDTLPPSASDGGDPRRDVLPSAVHDRFRHLTNYSVGRRHASMQNSANRGDAPLAESSSSSSGGGAAAPELKWALQRLWDHIDAPCNGATQATRRSSAAVRAEIAQLITRTLMAARPVINDAARRVQMPGDYFELYGFDVMLDARLTPSLIEVNTLPSLESSSAFDYAAKTSVVADLLNIALLEPFQRVVTPGSALCSAAALRGEGPHLLSSQTSPLLNAGQGGRDDAADSREEVVLRLQDELAYARGFHRIFPAKPPSTSHSDQPLDMLAASASYRADLQAYEGQRLLTERDTWALEA